MCGPSLSSSLRSSISSSCGFANGTANAARLLVLRIALLFVMTLAASGCKHSGGADRRDKPGAADAGGRRDG